MLQEGKDVINREIDGEPVLISLIIVGIRALLLRGSGFLAEIFFLGGGKIYCYANFSIVFGPNFKGANSPGGQLPQGGAPPVQKSQRLLKKILWNAVLG